MPSSAVVIWPAHQLMLRFIRWAARLTAVRDDEERRDPKRMVE